MKFFRRHLNTIYRRYVFIFFLIFIAVVSVSNVVIPSLNYQLVKPLLIKNITALIDSSMVKQSIIWTSNRMVYTLSWDQQLNQLISEYYESPGSEVGALAIDEHINESRSQSVFTWNDAVSTESYNLIIMDDGTVFGAAGIPEIAASIKEHEWYQKGVSNHLNTSYSPVMTITKANQIREYLCFANSIMVGTRQATVINVIDFAGIKRQYQEIEELGISDYIMLQDSRIIYQNHVNTEIALSDFGDEMYSDVQYQPMLLEKEEGLDFLVLCSMPSENFRIAFHIPKTTLLLPYENLLAMSQGFVYGVVLVILLTIFLITRNMLTRIKGLDFAMQEARITNHPILPPDNLNDEISRLRESFDIMLDDIDAKTAKMLNHEKRERHMQYALLVSAVDPHFIYNTLNTVTFLATMNRTEDVVKVNNALIATLKSRLQAKSAKPFDSVKVEKEALEQYIVIQNYLFSDKIRLYFHISTADLNLSIPKNIIQPLVENAIKHGILPNKGKDGRPLIGEIHITVYRRDDDKIEIIIMDNGIGMDNRILREYQNMTKDIENHEFDMSHIGIRNIYMRLVYLYGDNIDFIINSDHGSGTSFVIVLPPEVLADKAIYD